MQSVFTPAMLIAASLLQGNDRTGLEDNPYALDSKRACGAYCVGFLDRYFEGKRSYREISTICPPGVGGLSFEQMEAALQKMGYHTAGVTIPVESLQDLRWPCIVHEKTPDANGHFLVCIRWRGDSGTFQVFDPPRQLLEVTSSELARRIGTTVLVVSKDPLPAISELIPPQFTGQFYVGYSLAMFGGICLLGAWLRSRRSTSRKSMAVASMIVAAMLTMGCQQTRSDVVSPSSTTAAKDESGGGELVVDAGDVHQGTDLKAMIPIKNNTDTPFQIQNVERSCRCQTVKFDAEQIVSPGEETVVQVAVSTKEYAGPLLQRLIIHTVATTTSKATHLIPVVLKGNILTAVRAIPSQVMFGAVGSEATRQFRILTNPPELADDYASIQTPDFLQAQLIERKRGELLFNVTTLQNLPTGAFNGKVTVLFNHPQTPEFHVMAAGRKAGAIDVVPSRIAVNRRRQEQTLKVRIASTSERPFKILSSRSPAGVTPILDESEEPKTQYLIDVLVIAPELLEGKSITLKTDLVDEPEIRIPITITN